MGWGTILKEVYINRVRPEDVERLMEDEEDLIRMYSDDLLILAAATPREVNDGDGIELWEDYAARRVREAITGIIDSAVKQYQLGLIKAADPEDIIADA